MQDQRQLQSCLDACTSIMPCALLFILCAALSLKASNNTSIAEITMAVIHEYLS